MTLSRVHITRACTLQGVRTRRAYLLTRGRVQFKLYPQWRISVHLDRKAVIRGIFSAWLLKRKLAHLEGSLRAFLGESRFGTPVNLETLKLMDVGEPPYDSAGNVHGALCTCEVSYREGRPSL